MDALMPMIKNVLIFVALAIPGVILVKSKFVNQKQSGILSTLLMYVGMPFLILNSTFKISFDINLVYDILKIAAIGIGITLILFFLSKLLCLKNKTAKIDDFTKKKDGMIRFCSIISNNGFLGLPLAIAVFGADSKVFFFTIVLNIITNICIYTIGIFLISGGENKINLKSVFINPVVISFFLGMCLNLLDVQTLVPEISTYTTHLSNIVTPISMIIMGIKLGDIKIKKIFFTGKMYLVAFVKLLIVPIIAVSVSFAFGLGADFSAGLFVAFAMPTAGLAPTIADKIGGDTENAVIFTLGTTILAVLTIPLCYYLLTLLF